MNGLFFYGSASLASGFSLLSVVDGGLTPEHLALGALGSAIVFLWRQMTANMKKTENKLERTEIKLDESEIKYARLEGESEQCMRDRRKLLKMVDDLKKQVEMDIKNIGSVGEEQMQEFLKRQSKKE